MALYGTIIPINSEYLSEKDFVTDIPLTKWYVDCYPATSRAFYTYQGDSLCKECFVKRKNINP